MLRALLITAILFATSAAAGEIVWRSPIAGVLPYVSEREPEPEEPTGLGISYPALSVAVGKPFSISPTGVAGGGYEFSASGLPAGVVLSPDGRLGGVIMAARTYSFDVVVRRGGDFERISVKITAV